MPNVLDFLVFRQIGFPKSNKYVDGKKAVLDLLEYEAAKPSNNEHCEFSGEPRATFLVDFSPNMLRAASTHGDHSVRVTDIQTGKCTHVLTGHPRTPWCLAFNPTSNDILASGCLGGEVRIWDLLGGGSEVLHNPSLGAVITSLAFHPSGQVLVFATINCIYFWDWTKPTPFAVTKTNHEYERIRWLRFDPFGKYLYTGIANNTTLHGERARNVVNIRARSSDLQGDRHARSLLLRNRLRYNQLMQRFRSLQQSQVQRADYPESVRPRSPVHEESLNVARQYARHITESMDASLVSGSDGPRRRVHEGFSRSGILRDSFLPEEQSRHVDTRPDGERSRGGWGRYQPSFFTGSSATSATSTGSTNSGRRTRPSDSQSSIRRYFPSSRSHGRNRQLVLPYTARVPFRIVRPDLSRGVFVRTSSSSSSSSSRPLSSAAASSGNVEANHHSDELEPDEFEILPVDQSVSETANTVGNERRRDFDGMSAREMATRLERQLRQLRRELFQLTQRNMDINSAIRTLPSHGSGQSSSPTLRSGTAAATTSESSNLPRSAFRSAGSALSRSMFSRSASSSSNTSSSSSTALAYSPSSVLSSALSASSALSSSSPFYPSLLYSRSLPSTSSVPYISWSTSSGLTQRSVTGTSSSSSSTNVASQTNSDSSAIDGLSTSERQSISMRVIPTTVTDNTSQTFGAMNLPERLDRSTDITGLDSQRQHPMNVVLEAATEDGNDRDNNALGENQLDEDASNNSCALNSESREGSTVNTNSRGVALSSLIKLQSPSQTSTLASAWTSSHAEDTIASSECSTSSISVLRSALTASSSSASHVPLFSLSSSSSSKSTSTTASAHQTCALQPSSSCTNHGIPSHSSAMNDSHAFRSIANLNSSNDRRRESEGSTDLPVAESTTSSSTAVDEVSTSTSSRRGSTTSALRESIAHLRSRVSGVLHDIRTSQTDREHSNAGSEQTEERFLSQTSQILSQTTAYWTEFLGRSVMELNQRISELERRLETNQYLLSSSNPFQHQRPGRPQDALMSSLFGNRTSSARTRARNDASDSATEGEDVGGLNVRDDNNDDPPPPLPIPASRDVDSTMRQNARGQLQRNEILMDFLQWRGSRDSQSQRSLSFGQSEPTDSVTSPSQPAPQAPTLSSTLSAPSTSSVSSSSSSSVRHSVNIHPSLDEDVEEEEEEEADEEDDGDDEVEDDMMRDREEQGIRRGRRRRHLRNNNDVDEEAGARDEGRGAVGAGSRLQGMPHIHLHPDYSSSILDDTVSRPNEAMQHIMNRTIAGVLDREEQAVASNIIPQTHRIQRWMVSDVIVPNISRVTANIVVEQCKLHNDASCDISKDGTTLATFVPSHRGFPDDNILGVFSLRKETFAQCLYTKSFGPNAISVSISPANHYVMVGLAARRYFLFNKMVGQVYKLVREKAGEKSMEHITDLFHPRARGVQLHISVNFGRWLPGMGEGIVYGTNRGDLHICRPGPRRVPELDSSASYHPIHLRRSGSIRSSIATRTLRKTASTQT